MDRNCSCKIISLEVLSIALQSPREMYPQNHIGFFLNKPLVLQVFKSVIFLDSTYILKSADDQTLQNGTVLGKNVDLHSI